MAKKSPTGNPTKLKSLLRKAKAAAKNVEEPPACDPVAQLVISLLNFNATRRQAERAFTAMMNELVDLHDMRVSHPHELVALIGEKYPGAYDRVLRIREALNAVYQIEHDLVIKSVASKGKKEQRAYLDALPAVPPYAAAQVLLLSYGGHAMPVDDKLCVLLISEGVMPEDATPADAESFLARNIKAGDALGAHLALQAWADKRKGPASARPVTTRTATADARSAKKKAPARKKTAAATKKNTATKKTTKKKTARVAKKK